MSWYKILLLAVLSLGLTLPATAQRSRFKPQRHEISLEAVSLAQVPAWRENYASDAPFSLMVPSGVRYKYYLTMADGLRLGGFRQVTTLAQGSIEEATRTDYRLQLGYERNLIFGASRFFAGADATLGVGTVDFTQADPGGPITGSEGYLSYGVNPFFGYRLYFTPYLSTTLELGGYYQVHHYDANLAGPEGGAFLYPLQEWGMRGALSLSFHFGKLKKRCTCPRF